MPVSCMITFLIFSLNSSIKNLNLFYKMTVDLDFTPYTDSGKKKVVYIQIQLKPCTVRLMRLH